MIKVRNKHGISYIISENELKKYINKGFEEVKAKEVKPKVEKEKADKEVKAKEKENKEEK